MIPAFLWVWRTGVIFTASCDTEGGTPVLVHSWIALSGNEKLGWTFSIFPLYSASTCSVTFFLGNDSHEAEK